MMEKEEYEDYEEEEPPDVCSACYYETKKLHRSLKRPASRVDAEEAFFCEVCYSTLNSNAFWYPEQYPERTLLRTISYVTNMLLAAIKEQTQNE